MVWEQHGDTCDDERGWLLVQSRQGTHKCEMRGEFYPYIVFWWSQAGYLGGPDGKCFIN